MENKKTVYEYQDELGKTIFSKTRLHDSKTFYYEHYKNGIAITGMDGCRKVLYRLPKVLLGVSQNIPIFLVEGEKDADTLYLLELLATTSPGTLDWPDEFTQTLKDADVVILYDNDKTGLQRRDLLCLKLHGNVKRLRVIDLPGLEYRDKHGLDVTDWLTTGNTKEQLLQLLEQAQDYHHKKEHGGFRAVTINELFELDLPERKMLLEPFLPTQGLVLLVAKRGVGKTHMALGIAYTIASGSTFLRWHAPEAKKVLYVDGEMPASLMQERLRRVVAMSDKKHEDGFFILLTPDMQEKPMPDLATPEGREALEPFLEGIDLVVIDNISCLFRSGSENESESWQDAQEWALDLRRRGKSVLFVHHAGKNGLQRGTSKREDILDSVILLQHADDYKAEQGARFNVTFDKARHFSGQAASSFQVHLLQENNQWRWEMSNDQESELIEKVATLKASGRRIHEIEKELNLTKSQIETLTKKAIARGILISHP